MAEVYGASARRELPLWPTSTSRRTRGGQKYPSISLQLHQTGDKNADPSGRYRSARCGHPNPISWLLIGWGSWSQPAARVASRDNVEVLPHPGRITFDLRMKNPSIHLQLRQAGNENGDPPVLHRPAGCGKPQPHCMVADWLRLIAPARGESYLSGQRQRHAAPGEDTFLILDEKSLHTSTTPTTRGQNRDTPGRYRSARCGHPNPTGWLLIG